MKKSWLMSSLLAAALSCGAGVIDLSKGATMYVPGGAPVKLETADAPGNAGKGIEVPIEVKKSKYVELVFNDVAAIDSFGKLTVTVKVSAPKGCPVRSMGMRVTDASNETFQYPKSVNFSEGGVFEVRWEVNSKNFAGSWGGNNNKTIDFPARQCAFGIDYPQDGDLAKFQILSVEVIAEDTADALVDKLELDNNVNMYVPDMPMTKTGGLVSVPGTDLKGVKVAWNPSASNHIALGFEKPVDLIKFERLAVKGKFFIPAGSPLNSIGLRLQDKNDETFQFGQPFKAPANGGIVEVSWSVTPDAKTGSWGGDENKIMDQPLSVAGFGVDYAQTGTSAEFYLISLDVKTFAADTAKVAAANVPAADFAPLAKASGWTGDRGATKYVPGASGGEKLNVVKQDGADAVEIAWSPAASKYIEVVVNDPLEMKQFASAAVTADFIVPAGCPVRKIGLRLADKSGEIFQYGQTVDFSKEGPAKVTWSLAPDKANVSWGGNNDKVMDFPVKIRAFGIDYPQSAPDAKLYLTNISFRLSGGDESLATTQLYAFNNDNRFGRPWGKGELKLTNDGLTVSAFSPVTAINERKNQLLSYDRKISAITVDAQVTGDVKMRWGLRDGANQKLMSEQIALKSGKTVFDLSGLAANAKLPLQIEFFELFSADPAATVNFTDSTIALVKPQIESVALDIGTGNPLHVLKTGEEDQFQLVFANTSDKDGNFTFNLEFKDFAGNVATEKITMPLKAGEIKSVKPAFRPSLLGHYDVSCVVSEAKKPELSYQTNRSFAYLKPSGPTVGRAPGFLFGTNSHTARWGKNEQDKEIMAIALCGAKVARDSVEWYSLQPAKDVWQFEDMDYIVNQLAKNGVEVQALLGFTAKWAAPVDKQNSKNWLDWSRCCPDEAAWRNYVSTMVKRYQGKIRFWEVWNEPDLSGFNGMSGAEYAKLQKISYESAKAASPDAIVMTGGFATMSDHAGRKDKDFHRNHLINARGSFDIHAYHEHGAFMQYANLVDGKFLPMRKETNTLVPWYANETAIHSMGGSYKAQAVTLFKKALYSWARGSIGYTWYDLRNDGFDATDAEHHFGMLTNDFYPKMVYSTFNALTGLYGNMKFVRQIPMNPSQWLFQFADGKDILIAAWDESNFGSTMPLVFKTDAKSVNVVDLMGNRVKQPLLDGMTVLEVNQQPATLELVGAKTAKPLAPLINVDNSLVLQPKKRCSFKLQVFNPLAGAHEFSLKFESDIPGVKVLEPVKKVKLDADSKGNVDFTVEVSDKFNIPFGTTLTAKIVYQLAGTPWQGTILVPVNSAISLPGVDFTRPADFTLNQRTQVVSLVENDPAKRHLVWRDASDLSAKVWLGADKQSLKLKAEVTDDIHNQPFEKFNVWQGDNIQFGLQLPDQNGYWEIGLSRLNNGSSEVFVFQAPDKFPVDAAQKAMKLVTGRNGDKTVYELEIPLSAIGMDLKKAAQGVRFNLLVNENDGEGRDGWIHIAPGIGENKNPDKFPMVIFE